MTNDEILMELRTRRTSAMDFVAKAQADVDRLDMAIAALEGRTAGPTVAELVEAAIRSVVRPHLPKTIVFDYATVKAECERQFKDRWPHVKKGFYSAMAALVKSGVIRKTSGGHELVPR